ncbi:Polysaccharide biosynthesis protein GumN [Flavobacterium longum]|uniref:TraB/GumN family protein n=1 Tax=Flavobacterium longum TaxID=1299340 RepID=UPI0039E93493
MKKLLFVAAIFASTLAFGQNAGTSGNAKSLLWKISGNGLTAPSYLYGTIHITCDATLEKPTLDAIANTAQLYLELDMDDPQMQMTMVQGMMMKEGKTMKTMMSDADYKMVDAYFTQTLGMGLAALDKMKPFMLTTLVLPSMLDCPMQSVEQELMRVNASQNKEVLGLETVQEQLAVFDAIPYDVQLAELIKSVRNNFANDKAELVKMYAVYQSKDIDAMQLMTAESENKITADYQDELLNDRNANWIPKIEQIAKQKPTFFGVGAGHLGGGKGVIALLRKKGYTVEPVN